MIDYDYTTPISYAKALAYLPCPSTIRSRVADQFGKARAPSVEQCQNLRLAYLGKKTARRARCQERYGRNFRCDHPQTEANTIITIDGIDTCKTCATLKRDVKQAERDRSENIMRQQRERQAKIEQTRAAYAEALATPLPPCRPLFPREVIDDVAQLFLMTADDILGDNRFTRYVDARATVAKILHNRGLSYPHVGRIMGRDHSTIINLITRLDRYKARNPMVDHVLGIVS